jgi:hypothetical protein
VLLWQDSGEIRTGFASGNEAASKLLGFEIPRRTLADFSTAALTPPQAQPEIRDQTIA